ncbi:MAG: DUF1385 domain-containing protein [Alphaproteobacteria bacterium]|uniref:DUF1385 domain-containing protein n=1 Tax=Candidatus Nitrobium versatile TaxID=2884831 RepID=A0A953J7D4_9BACT|nr:DUF1385 domain-containing protein [Candidatus Nitrobium versatile]
MKNIGGQAVIEGVMMKSPAGWTVAVRGPKGDISLKTVRTAGVTGFLKWPVIRGMVALFQALSIGIRAIEFSGNIAYQEEADEKPLSPLSMAFSLGTALLLAVALFVLLPLFVTKLAGTVIRSVETSSLLFNLVDGLLRVGIFLLYVFSIGLWREMRRIYEYHGAEHKVIYAYEAGEELSVENAKKYKPYHPRCGTSFLLIVMVISIIVFSFIPQHWSFAGKALSRLILIPAIAGISYEVLRSSAKMQGNPLVGLMILPGLLLQRLTVREPDNAQIEVALAAMSEVLKLDEGSAREVCRRC